MAGKQQKTAFNIAEMADLAEVKPHVLRYWETEFPALNPEKNSSGQRVYRAKDLDTVLHLKRLLYEEQYTIAGARKRLVEDQKDARRNQLPLELNLGEAEMAGQLMKAKKKLKALIEMLEK